MARPRQFDQAQLLEAAVQCFWDRGYAATSVQDLVRGSGVTAASLYNAFGDKRAIFRAALEHYVDTRLGERMRRCDALPPEQAIRGFFEEVVRASLNDPAHKGCMLVNTALELAPHDAELRARVSALLRRLERFFLRHVEAGQAAGSFTRALPAQVLAGHLVGVLMGLRVLARARPRRGVLEDVVAPALALLGGVGGGAAAR
jgi:TetR/AcrR family transcriptional regulator, transcriptional repressor for nem operon